MARFENAQDRATKEKAATTLRSHSQMDGLERITSKYHFDELTASEYASQLSLRIMFLAAAEVSEIGEVLFKYFEDLKTKREDREDDV